jgi:hypothetical protein
MITISMAHFYNCLVDTSDAFALALSASQSAVAMYLHFDCPSPLTELQFSRAKRST